MKTQLPIGVRIGHKCLMVRSVPDRYDGKKWHYREDRWPVKLMAVADGYAMMRRKNGSPYVELVKCLFPLDDAGHAGDAP